MRTYFRVLLAIVFLCAGMAVSLIASAEDVTITIAKKKGIGSYLVSSTGKALYYYKKDSPGKSECFGECIDKFPVYCYRTDQVTAGPGLKKSDFGFFMRTELNGNTQEQLTYKGIPLYEYAADGPGDTKGHGMDNLWFLVRP